MFDALRYELNVDFNHDKLFIFEIYRAGSVHLVTSKPLNGFDGNTPTPEVMDWLEFEGFIADWGKIELSSSGYVYPLEKVEEDVH